MALLLYMKPVHGLLDRSGSLSNCIPPQVITKTNLELQETKASRKCGSYTQIQNHSLCWDWTLHLPAWCCSAVGHSPGSSNNHFNWTGCLLVHNFFWKPFVFSYVPNSKQVCFALCMHEHPLALRLSRELIFGAFNFCWCTLVTKIKIKIEQTKNFYRQKFLDLLSLNDRHISRFLKKINSGQVLLT